MSVFSKIADNLGGRKPGQTDTRRPVIREEASKKPRIRLSSAGEGVHMTPRSSVGDVRIAPSVGGAITVADDEAQPVKESMGKLPSAPSLVVQEAASVEQVSVALVTSSLGPSVSPEPSSGHGGPGSVSSTAQFFARNVCSHLDKIKEYVASRDQAKILEQKAVISEQKMEEILSLLRRLEPSEAEKTIVVLESKCGRLENDLEVVTAQVEELMRERGTLMSRIEELEEENRRRKVFYRSVRDLVAESEPGFSL
ncbi:hypothetical protein AXF42_Ash002875 [Apostasia shenzhenica]|uniref:Uncharacterized protein n=1 Tax=Apostasia shenzhenica TaxID=1088818 RepID=A0A2I0A7I2_9ASPA|nr:hypothetical protein AXF42_Ash002875 [Apostasia shenzhenica]